MSYLEAVLPFDSSCGSMRADPLTHAVEQITNSLGGRNNVERWRKRTFVVKIAEPQFCPGKLPLFVLMILEVEGKTDSSH